MASAVLAGGLLFACSANALPAAISGSGPGRPAPLVIACQVATYDTKGEPDHWRCQACIGDGICSASWLSDVDQSGTYH